MIKKDSLSEKIFIEKIHKKTQIIFAAILQILNIYRWLKNLVNALWEFCEGILR